MRILTDDPSYESFLRPPGPGPDRVDVGVKLLLDEAPDTAGLPLLFDSGSSWRAFRDGEDVLLELRLSDPADCLLWLARLPLDLCEVTIHCGVPLVKRESAGVTLRSPLGYPLDELLMMHLLSAHRGLLLHAAGVRKQDRVVVFPGRSGAGKSSLMRLLAGCEGLERLSDDRIVLREIGGSIRGYGTPWAGTELVAANGSGVVQAIAFLHQARETRIRRIDAREALAQLLPVTSILWFDSDRTRGALAFCEQLLVRVPFYELHFRKHAEVAASLAELMGE